MGLGGPCWRCWFSIAPDLRGRRTPARHELMLEEEVESVILGCTSIPLFCALAESGKWRSMWGCVSEVPRGVPFSDRYDLS